MAGCGGSSAHEIRERTAVDVEAELDRLFACSLRTLDAEGHELADVDANRHRVTTSWTLTAADEQAERRRVTVFVFSHPYYGPGINVSFARHRWNAAGDPRLDEPLVPNETEDGWLAVPIGDEGEAYEREVAALVGLCWEELRERALESETPPTDASTGQEQ